MNNIRKFLLNTAIVTFTSIIIQFVSTTFSVYVANVVGSEAVGTFQLLMSIYMFAITLATSSINLAATRIIAELENNKNDVAKIMKQCIIYSLSFGILACILMCFFAPYIVTNFFNNKISTKVIYIMALGLPFTAFSSAVNRLFFCDKKNS